MTSGLPSSNESGLQAWRAAALRGEGSPWLRPSQAEALAQYALRFGEGVSMMEAVATPFREPVRETDWEILGADAEGENWDDHGDPARALTLLRRKFRVAQTAGAVLEYKIWLART